MTKLLQKLGLLAMLLPSIAASQTENSAAAEVESVVTDKFHEVLSDYDAAVAAEPGNIRLRLRRCEIISTFYYFENFYLEAAEELIETCFVDLETDFPGHPEIELTQLADTYGDAVVERNDAIHDTSMAFWTNAQHARLHYMVAEATLWNEDGSYEFHCRRAMELDLSADCRVGAAEWHWQRGESEVAIDMLTSPIDRNYDSYHLVQKLEKLSEYEAWDGFSTVYALLPDDLVDYERVSVSQLLIKAERFDDASKMLGTISDSYWDTSALASTRLDLARATGDADKVIEYYNEIRDADYWNDPILRVRLGIATDYPGLPWKLRDVLGILMLIAIVGVLAAMAVILPAGVHYRGLVRSSHQRNAGLPNGLWTLRNAWYAIFAVLISELVAVYLFDYEFLHWMMRPSGTAEYYSENVRYDLMIMCMTMLSLLMVLPLVATRERWRSWLAQDWHLGKTIGVALGIAILARIAFAIYANIIPAGWQLAQVSATFEGISMMNEHYGALITLAVIAVIVPIAEETIFRGILLQGFARHISFNGANWIQALMFASVHEEFAFFPLYTAFGLVAGKISQRSGSLLCAIMMHAVFNAAAAWVMIAILG